MSKFTAMKERVIVSLTTWKARMANIPAVLGSIFAQSRRPDLVVLNLAYDEIVPPEIQEYLDTAGVEIFRTADTKVYKKLLPTMLRYPDDCIINIDDDFIYPREMIADFMEVHARFPNLPISGNRVHSRGMNCHCGCASLTKAGFFGDSLRLIDEGVTRNCPSDDIVFTYLAASRGLHYIHTKGKYSTNMTPCNPAEPYSSNLPSAVPDSWEYMEGRFGALEEMIVPRPKVLVLLGIRHSVQIPYFVRKLGNVSSCDWRLLVNYSEADDEGLNKLKSLKEDTILIQREGSIADTFASAKEFIGDYDYLLCLHSFDFSCSIDDRVPARSTRFQGWRNLMTDALLESPVQFRNCLRMIANDKQTGLVCRGRFLSGRKKVCKGAEFLCRTAAVRNLFDNEELRFADDNAFALEIAGAVNTNGFISKGIKCKESFSDKLDHLARKCFSVERFGSKGSKYLTLFGCRYKLSD